jgi:hypothetical protein
MRITFVSNFELEDISGGWNGINANVFNELKKVCDIEYVGGINPPFNYLEKAVSKLRRVLHFKGSYSFFAESRLNEINRQLTEKGIRGDQILYFGATPWVKHRFSQPYSVYMDICFKDYIGLYVGEDQFDRKDISRIVEQEKLFLENADPIDPIDAIYRYVIKKSKSLECKEISFDFRFFFWRHDGYEL